MLDTNMVGQLMKRHPAVARRIVAASMVSLCISAITAGELIYSLEHNPDAIRLPLAVGEFLRRVDVLPWDHEVARCYGTVRAAMHRGGKTLTPLDLLIATHAISIGSVLVTDDKAFRHLPELNIEDWTE